MNESDFPLRRTLMVGLAVVGLAPLAGCMTKPLRAVNAVEAEAKRFAADPAALTVYVLRSRWGNASVVVPVTVDGAASAATIPESLARLRLTPGAHRLSAQWEDRTVDISVQGRTGDLRVVELIGSGWTGGTSFSWRPFRPMRSNREHKPRSSWPISTFGDDANRIPTPDTNVTPTIRNSLVHPGVAAALAAAALFGAGTPLAKQLLGTVDPWLLAGLLYLGSGGGLAL